jgi:flagellar hook-associated protein 1
MRSSFTGIEMAKRSLFTQQAALQTTGHNIANANTRGYSRQVVNMVAAKPLEAVGMSRSTVPGQMGQSVVFDHIDRIREKFLVSQFQYENKNLGDWEIRKDTLDKLEAILLSHPIQGYAKL